VEKEWRPEIRDHLPGAGQQAGWETCLGDDHHIARTAEKREKEHQKRAAKKNAVKKTFYRMIIKQQSFAKIAERFLRYTRVRTANFVAIRAEQKRMDLFRDYTAHQSEKMATIPA